MRKCGLIAVEKWLLNVVLLPSPVVERDLSTIRARTSRRSDKNREVGAARGGGSEQGVERGIRT